jgi:site-specific DNA-cytosine methylase
MSKKLLELFSGTGSVGDVARELGFEVVSLDRDMPADFKVDIMDWDPRLYHAGYFDVIWASPPCTEYSRAKTTGVRDIEGSNEVVQRTLDIIEYLEPKYWIIENPQTGLLKDQLCMYGLPFKDVDYCRYGMPYRKRTRLWNNCFDWRPRPLCNKDCDSMNETRTRHKEEAQRNGSTAERRLTGRRFKQSELYKVPSDLIKEIFLSLEVSQ